MGESSQTPCYPPTLAVGKGYLQGSGRNVRAHGSVKYKIEALLHCDDTVICAREADIKVVNCVNDLPPPIPLDDFPDEYRCAISKSLAGGRLKSWLSRKFIAPIPQPHMTIEVIEPQAICLVLGSPSDGPSTIDLTTTFRLSQLPHARSDAGFRPDIVHMTMDWSLKTTTFVAVIPMREMPARAETMSNPFIARTSVCTPERSGKMVLRDWQSTYRQDGLLGIPFDSGQEWCRESTEAPCGEEGRLEWYIEQRLYLTIDTTQECATTFFTPYISRRHTLQLRLGCHNMGNTMTQFKFEVPVQIVLLDRSPSSRGLEERNVHGSVPSPGDDWHQAQTELSESPPYVR